jgi:hypothetical protein
MHMHNPLYSLCGAPQGCIVACRGADGNSSICTLTSSSPPLTRLAMFTVEVYGVCMCMGCMVRGNTRRGHVRNTRALDRATAELRLQPFARVLVVVHVSLSPNDGPFLLTSQPFCNEAALFFRDILGLAVSMQHTLLHTSTVCEGGGAIEIGTMSRCRRHPLFHGAKMASFAPPACDSAGREDEHSTPTTTRLRKSLGVVRSGWPEMKQGCKQASSSSFLHAFSSAFTSTFSVFSSTFSA